MRNYELKCAYSIFVDACCIVLNFKTGPEVIVSTYLNVIDIMYLSLIGLSIAKTIFNTLSLLFILKQNCSRD